MATSPVSRRGMPVVIICAVGIIALAARWSSWPWATIGGQLALAGVVLMLLRDRVSEYAESFRGMPNTEALADSGGRPAARWLHPLIYAIGIPLVILGAVFQVVGNPADKLILRAR